MAGCECGLCRRGRRLAYIQRQLRRVGDEPAADWLDVMYTHLLDIETELELHAYVDEAG